MDEISDEQSILKQQQKFDSVVKIFVTSAVTNYSLPWQVQFQRNSTGSGFLIEKRRILTNAHVIRDAKAVLVRRHGCAKRYSAKVVCCGYQCDLALLELADDEDAEQFFRDAKPLKFIDAVPHMQEAVCAVGFPTGGETLSVTKGIVSRVGVQSYGAAWQLIALQIDAAINPGNSGGPVLNRHGDVVGVAFSVLLKSQNIGYIIPNLVVEHFLRDFEASGESIWGDIGVREQEAENKALRRYHQMEEEHSGVILVGVNPFGCSAGHLKEEDVVMEIEGVKIADDGTIVFRGTERIEWSHLIDMLHIGDELHLKILRNGKEQQVTFKLGPVSKLVPSVDGWDAFPSYLLVGPLVFQPLSVPLLAAFYGKDWSKKAPVELLKKCECAQSGRNFSHTHIDFYDFPSKEGEEVVVISQILASKIALGYNIGSVLGIVHEFNSQSVDNLAHLYRLTEKCDEEYLSFKIGNSKADVVLRREDCLAMREDILKTYSISDYKSIDLK